MINIQSSLRTAPDLCINVSLALFFASIGNSYTVRYVCMYTYSSQYRDAGRVKDVKKLGQQWLPRPRKSSGLPFWARAPQVRHPWTKWYWDRFFSEYFRFPDISNIPPLYPTDLHMNGSVCRRAISQDLRTFKTMLHGGALGKELYHFQTEVFTVLGCYVV